MGAEPLGRNRSLRELKAEVVDSRCGGVVDDLVTEFHAHPTDYRGVDDLVDSNRATEAGRQTSFKALKLRRSKRASSGHRCYLAVCLVSNSGNCSLHKTTRTVTAGVTHERTQDA